MLFGIKLLLEILFKDGHKSHKRVKSKISDARQFLISGGLVKKNHIFLQIIKFCERNIRQLNKHK